MRWIVLTLVSVALLAQPAQGSPPEHNLVYFTSEIINTDAHFWIYLPEDYYNNTDIYYPLVMFFVGSGETGTNPASLLKNGPNAEIARNGGVIPAGAGMENMIFVTSMEPSSSGGTNLKLAREVYDKITRDYRINTNQFYVTGLSYGGNGTHQFTLTYSDIVTASVPMSCANWKALEKTYYSIYAESIPIWVIHGANDNQPQYGITPGTASYLIKNIRNHDPLLLDPRFSLVTGYGHSGELWSGVYSNRPFYKSSGQEWTYEGTGIDSLGDSAIDSIYTWMKSYSKGGTVEPEWFNVALGKVAVGSSTYKDYTANRAVDGIENNNTSRWVSLPSPGEQTLTIDFAGSFVINEVELTSGYNSDFAVGEISIEYDDGTQWMPLPDGIIYDNPATNTVIHLTFDSLVANGIRIRCLDNDYVRIKEVRVMGMSNNEELNNPPEWINIVSGKPASASTTYKDYTVERAVDTIVSNSSRWLSLASTDEQTLTIDMQGTYVMKSIRIDTGYNDSFAISDCDIEYFDGSGWYLVPGGSVRDNPLDGTVIAISFDNIVAEQLRIRFFDTDYVRIKDVEALGYPLPEQSGKERYLTSKALTLGIVGFSGLLY